MPLKFTSGYLRDDQTVLRVSPRALDRAFAATDPKVYRTISEVKVTWMLKHLDGQTFRAPIVGVLDGRICFENGRHRARVARRQGLKVIPVIVDKDNVAAVRELLARFQKAPQRRAARGPG
jgi:hypothetical protein